MILSLLGTQSHAQIQLNADIQSQNVNATPAPTGLVDDQAVTAGSWLIVTQDPRSERQRRGLAGPGYRGKFAYDSDPVLERYGAQIAKQHNLQVTLAWPIRALALHCLVVQGLSPDQQLSLDSDKRVAWIQPFNYFELRQASQLEPIQTDLSAEEHAQAAKTGDPQASLRSPKPASGGAIDWLNHLHGFSDEYMADLSKVSIAVIDTGADLKHPALRHANLSYTDHVNDGFAEAEAHGTAVLGLLAARSNVVNGLADEAKLSLLRACWQYDDGGGKCSTLTLARAFDELLLQPPALVNLSLSGPVDRVLQLLVNQLVEKGTIIVAAYDPQRPPTQRFPLAQSGTVFAFGQDSEMASEVGFENSIDTPRMIPRESDLADKGGALTTLSAPGTVMTLAPHSRGAEFKLARGHSIATPQITAMLARIKASEPSLENLQLITALELWLSQHQF